MRSAVVYSYSVPMESGVILRDRRLKQREGVIVKLSEGERSGWGEIAPLPGFSLETVEQATEVALLQVQNWCEGNELSESGLASVDFGLSCALAELCGMLCMEGNYNTVPLCYGDPDELMLKLSGLPGRKVAKMKVGLYEAVRDGLVVSTLLEAVPDLFLRLDANRSWTLNKAEAFAKYVPVELRERIEFLEEPCKTRQASLQFAQQSGIAIAWDESVREPGFQVEPDEAVSAIIIKPTLTGSLAVCRRLVEQAHQAGLMVVISSGIETSLGLNQLAQLAAWLTPKTPPGLDTLDLMQGQLIRPWPGSSLPLSVEDDLNLLWRG